MAEPDELPTVAEIAAELEMNLAPGEDAEAAEPEPNRAAETPAG